MGNASIKTYAPDHILAELKCIRCKELLSCPPILLFPDHGNMCGRCEGYEYPEKPVRNIAYEASVKLLTFPCRYSRKGCKADLKWDDVIKHEQTCLFRIYHCPVLPLGNCSWQGTRQEMEPHFRAKHDEYLFKLKESKFDLTIDSNQTIFFQIASKPYLLQLKYKADTSTLHCILMYFEQLEKNSEHAFEITFYPKNGNVSFAGTGKYCFPADAVEAPASKMMMINMQSIKQVLSPDRYVNYAIDVSVVEKTNFEDSRSTLRNVRCTEAENSEDLANTSG